MIYEATMLVPVTEKIEARTPGEARTAARLYMDKYFSNSDVDPVLHSLSVPTPEFEDAPPPFEPEAA